MNGRMSSEETPEGRLAEQLAAVAKSLSIQMWDTYRKTGVGPREPDSADYREAFRLYIQRALVLARIDEARKSQGLVLTARVQELAAELAAIDKLLKEKEGRQL